MEHNAPTVTTFATKSFRNTAASCVFPPLSEEEESEESEESDKAPTTSDDDEDDDDDDDDGDDDEASDFASCCCDCGHAWSCHETLVPPLISMLEFDDEST